MLLVQQVYIRSGTEPEPATCKKTKVFSVFLLHLNVTKHNFLMTNDSVDNTLVCVTVNRVLLISCLTNQSTPDRCIFPPCRTFNFPT